MGEEIGFTARLNALIRFVAENFKQPIDAPAAARAAAAYLEQMVPQAELPLLEEVEKITEQHRRTYWIITLSFQLNTAATSRSFPLVFGKREYKTFKIDAATGEVVSMKIKTV